MGSECFVLFTPEPRYTQWSLHRFSSSSQRYWEFYSGSQLGWKQHANQCSKWYKLFIYIPSWVSSHQFMMNSHPTELPYPATAVSYPFIMWDKLGKGQIVVNLGDPEVSKNYVGWVYNTLFLAMSKPVILEYTTNITEIPAFSIIALSFEIQLNNVYQENLVYVSTFQ